MAPPGPEEQDSLLLQRKSARRCVKQRPSYDIFEDSDDSEPGGPPAPRRRTPRENGANCLLLPLSVSPVSFVWKRQDSQTQGFVSLSVEKGGGFSGQGGRVQEVFSSLLNKAQVILVDLV